NRVVQAPRALHALGLPIPTCVCAHECDQFSITIAPTIQPARKLVRARLVIKVAETQKPSDDLVMLQEYHYENSEVDFYNQTNHLFGDRANNDPTRRGTRPTD